MPPDPSRGEWKRDSIHYMKSIIRIFLETLAFTVALLFRPKRVRIPQLIDNRLLIPAVELSKQIKEGKVKCEQVVELFIEQIERVNPILNAVVFKRYEQAIDEACQLDKSLTLARNGDDEQRYLLDLPLVGIPFTFKETIALEGCPFTAGIARRRFVKALRSNKAVDQLIKSGLIPIASTNTPCMNLWWDSYNLVYGRTNNPYDLGRIPGGSSGGEAAILAAAGSLLGVGSDLAGSIRIPCNFCGIFGHKPTPFSVSTDGLFPAMKREQDKLRGVGPMTRYASDLMPMLKIMLNRGEADKMRLDDPVDLSAIKVFYCEDIGDSFVSGCDADILAGLKAAVAHLNSAYHIPTKLVQLEEFRYGLPLWSAELSPSGGFLYALDEANGMVPFNPFVELYKSLFARSEFPFNTILTCALESFIPKHGSRRHLSLTQKASKLRERFLDLVGDEGVLLIPAHPQTAPHHLTTIFKFLNVAYTAVVNTLQAPVTQCPLGMSRDGLPFGVQIISRPYNDRLTLAVARELENAFGGWQPPFKDGSRTQDDNIHKMNIKNL